VAFPKIFLRPVSAGSWLEEVIAIIGTILILSGQLLRVSARGHKSENSANSSALVTSGPYTLTRNPMYLGIVLIAVGVTLAIFKIWFFAIFLAVFTFSYVRLIRHEEIKLFAAFPAEYPKYQRSTPQFFPSWKVFLSEPIEKSLPIKRAWLWKESGTIFGLLAAVIIVEVWRDIQDVPGVLSIVFIFAILTVIICWRTEYGKKPKTV
jgi:protein-S-isoprenylcysteine O-methyltransferase Ste14